MCELLGMSANHPSDVNFTLTGLFKRGGITGPHKDGWGIGFYEGRACRIFKDTVSSIESTVARFVLEHPFHSSLVISHIRRANRGRVCLANTHPFARELWGRTWIFVHNGQLRGIKKKTLHQWMPVGTTDSEHAFCWLMEQIKARFPKPPRRDETLWRFVAEHMQELGTLGVANMLLSDSRYLYAHASTKMATCQRQAPFAAAHLVDEEMSLDLNASMSDDDKVLVVATAPLTRNEHWERVPEGTVLVCHEGAIQKRYAASAK